MREQDYVLNLARLQFYKHHFGRVLTFSLIEMIVIFLLVGAFIWVKTRKVDREYFAVESQTGRIIPMIPLSQPYLTDAALLTWAQQCIIDANTFDFVNYRKQFSQHAQCFTQQGWQQFMSAISRAGTLETVKKQRLISQGIPTGAPVITRTSVHHGTRFWEIEQPVTISYQGGQAGRATITQRLLITLTVTRVPTYENVQGVGIVQYVGMEM